MNNSECLLYRSVSLWQLKLKRRSRDVCQTWPLQTVYLISHGSVCVPPAFILFHIPDFLERYSPLFSTVRSSHGLLQQLNKRLSWKVRPQRLLSKNRVLSLQLQPAQVSMENKILYSQQKTLDFGGFVSIQLQILMAKKF